MEITNVAVAVGEDGEVADEDTTREERLEPLAVKETITVVRGTTVTPTPTSPTPTPPSGIAFTGTGALVSLVGFALLMLTLGTGLLWVGPAARCARSRHTRSLAPAERRSA